MILIPVYGGVGAAVATVVSYAAAGYLACFLTPNTREAGRMITLALVVPVRAAIRALRGGGSGGRTGGGES
jgi:PST family polysaccharide transporter